MKVVNEQKKWRKTKMKMVKGVALLLSMIMLLSCLSACGSGKKTGTDYTDSEEKQVNLVVAFPFAATADIDVVQDKINEELKSLLPNTTIELLCDAAMQDKWTLWMSGKKVIDITHSGYAMDLTTEITKKSFLPMNDLIEEYAPTVKEEMESGYPDLYNTGKYKGELYGIPCVQIFANDTYELRYHTELESYFDPAKIVEITHNQKHTTEELYEYLDSVFATIKAEKGEFYIGAKRMNIPTMARKGYTMINGTNLCFDNYAEEVKIIDFHETDEFKTYIKWIDKWYKDGYVSKDVLSSTSVQEQFFSSTGSLYGTDENYMKRSSGWTMVSIENPEDKIRTISTIGEIKSYMSIPATSENPARAMKFLELIRTKEGAVIANLLAYGIEGVHYEKTSDTEIKAFDYEGQGTSQSKYSIPQWMVGNNFNMLIVSPFTQKQADWAKDYLANQANSVPKHVLYGLSFDLSGVNVKLSNVLSVNSEYEPQLTCGVLEDYEATYQTLLQRTKDAGIEDIIKELQSQADEYISSK